jgi:hypothetical protein
MMMSGPQTTPAYLTLRERVSALEAQYGGVGRMEAIVLDYYHWQNGLEPFSAFKAYAKSNRGHFSSNWKSLIVAGLFE